MARSSKLESGFQDRLISELKTLFPGCMVFKMDQIQGIPDLLILYGKKWASLEHKKSLKAKRQPNQEYYVELMNKMSFSTSSVKIRIITSYISLVLAVLEKRIPLKDLQILTQTL